MAIVTLFSAHGSPGVSTAALGLALHWPRAAVFLEADASGASSLGAGYFRGAKMATDETLVDLAMPARQGRLAAELPHHLMAFEQSPQTLFMRGSIDHQQANTLNTLWDVLPGVLRALERNGQDVIVDCGRLGTTGFPTSVVRQSDIALLTLRSRLTDVVAASSWAESLSNVFAEHGLPDQMGQLVIGPGRPYSEHDLQRSLGVPVLATLPWDPKAAAIFSDGQWPKRWKHAPLVRALPSTAERLRNRLISRTLPTPGAHR